MDCPVSTLLFLVLSVAVASAATVPEDYWHQQLPNTPIPGAIRTLLCPDLLREARDHAPVRTGIPPLPQVFYYMAYRGNESQARNDPGGAIFFLEQDLHNTRKRPLHFIRSAPPAPFIPRPVADVIPFSSKKLPELMARFSLPSDSAGAEDMRKSLHWCEHPAMAGETASCVVSFNPIKDEEVPVRGRLPRTQAHKEHAA